MRHFLAFWNRYEQRVAAWVGILGFLVLLSGWLGIGLFAESTRELVYASGLVFALLGSSATFLVMCVKLHRRASYAEAFANVREAVRKIEIEDLASHSTDERK